MQEAGETTNPKLRDAYARYCAFCELVGSPPMSFEGWQYVSARLFADYRRAAQNVTE